MKGKNELLYKREEETLYVYKRQNPTASGDNMDRVDFCVTVMWYVGFCLNRTQNLSI